MKGVVGIMGCAKGGTSAVSGVVRILGMPMYGTYKSNDDHTLYNMIDKPGLVEFVERRGGSWAFKHPDLWPWRDKLRGLFPDLKLILVHRDPVAVASHRCDDGNPSKDRLTEAVRVYSAMAEESGLHVSFERLMSQPRTQVERIADFLSLPMNENVFSYLDGRDYKDIRPWLTHYEQSPEAKQSSLIFSY